MPPPLSLAWPLVMVRPETVTVAVQLVQFVASAVLLEVVPGLVEVEVAVPRSMPAVW